MKDDRLYVIHVMECIARIEQYTTEGKDAFFADRKTQDAVVRNLQVLAESTRRLSNPLKLSRPDVDWRGLAGFRNVAVHDYLGIDTQQIWHIVEHDLPELKPKIAAILASLKIRSS